MTSNFQHRFVEFVPLEIAEGILYISLEYATASHLCACGCGRRVVTPLSPVRWRMTFDGETVSLTPSIGNWEYPCQSHYWIRQGRVEWAERWGDRRIKEGRKRQREAIDEHTAQGESPGLRRLLRRLRRK